MKDNILVISPSPFYKNFMKQVFVNHPNICIIGTFSSPRDLPKQFLNQKIRLLAIDSTLLFHPMLSSLLSSHFFNTPILFLGPYQKMPIPSINHYDFISLPKSYNPTSFAIFQALCTKKCQTLLSNLNHSLPASYSAQQQKKYSPQNTIIAIGASTGGTEATLQVVKTLPKNTPGIVIVQHMPTEFTSMYAERLNRECNMKVIEGKTGDKIEVGTIIVAPGGCQTIVKKDQIGASIFCENTQKISWHCPSVDVLFYSVANVYKDHAIGVLLTGMGSDGAKGMLELKKAGGYTIGQDEKTSVIYGMPKVANEIGAVKKQLPLPQIQQGILSHLTFLYKQ